MNVVTPGMTRRQVKRLLGPPHAKTDDRSYARLYKSAGWFGRRGKNEYWLYGGVPDGHDTQIIFTRGRVVEVRTPRRRPDAGT